VSAYFQTHTVRCFEDVHRWTNVQEVSWAASVHGNNFCLLLWSMRRAIWDLWYVLFHSAFNTFHLWTLELSRFLLCDAVHKHSLCHGMVWMLVMFMYCTKMAKHILNLFSPSGSPAILIVSYNLLWWNSDGPLKRSVGVWNNHDFWPTSVSFGHILRHCVRYKSAYYYY